MEDRTEPGGARARRREAELLRVVKVALKLFVDQGFDKVTADDISLAADISRRTFFRYFPSKDDVLIKLHRRSMQRVALALRERPLDEPFHVAVSRANRTVAEAEVEPDEQVLRELSTRLLLRQPATWERMIRQAGREIEVELEKAIATRLSGQGNDPDAAGPLAAVAWSVGCCVFRRWLADGAEASLTDLIDDALLQVRDAL